MLILLKMHLKITLIRLQIGATEVVYGGKCFHLNQLAL